MEADGEQNQQRATTKGNTSGPSSRTSPINSMSLYERQAVQALQALQRQPNAAQYFQQLMLQQQISNAQLQNLAAVQQVKATLAASRQSSPSSNGSSSQTTSSTATTVTSGSPSNHPVGASAASTVSQSVLLNGTSGGQGQMYLRVNRSLRAPLSSQLIFMPGRAAVAAAAAAATVTQQPEAEAQVAPTSSLDGHSDSDQVQNLAMRAAASTTGTSVKTEVPEKIDSAAFSLVQPSSQSVSPAKPGQPQSQAPHIRIPTYPQPANLKALPSSSRTPPSSSTSSIPLSQLLLHNTRTLTAGTTASSTTHALLLTSSAASHPHSYSVSTASIKPAVNGQTLVVQPLQKTSHSTEKPGNGPVPIQPKALRLPLQLSSRNPPPILPAPPPISTTAPLPQPPHIPVQIVGARQNTLGNTQALGLARSNCCQDGGPVLTSSASLLTMVASIASKQGGALGRGVGLKTVQSPQEAPPLSQVSQVHPQANQNSGQSPNGHVVSSPTSSPSPTVPAAVASMSQSPLFLPPGPEEQKGSSTFVITNGENTTEHETPQAKQLTVSLKRKSNCNSAADEDGPSPPQLQTVRDPVASSPADAGSGAPATVALSPSPVLTVVHGVCSQGGRPPPPQAVVKPNILTHLIEGFVIHEGAEPFPMCNPVKDSTGEELTHDCPVDNQSESVITAKVLKCEYCKSFAPASQFRGTKRFCSMTCAKRYNISFRQSLSRCQGRGRGVYQDSSQDHLSNSDEEEGLTRRRVPRRTSSEIASAKIAGRFIAGKCHSEPSHSGDTSGEEGEDEDDLMSLSPASSASCHQPPPLVTTETSAHSCLPVSPTEWSTEEVSHFIASLQGCEELASQFLSQEIDGQALLLLKEEHLMSTMNIKLGPALKICAHINSLRD